mgnify:CR=1 FL=1
MLRVWLALAMTIPALITAVTLVVTSGGAQKSSQSVPSTMGRAASLPQLQLNRGPASEPSSLGSASFDSGSALSEGDTTLAMRDVGYQPKEEVYLADPSNYDQRVAVDSQGTPVDNDYIVVLHETVGDVVSAINTFQTPHPNDDDQVSYHALIALDGTVIYIVPPEQRAFGAGNSVFVSPKGEESVSTNAEFASSVNNFAYHISLETPPDGQLNDNSMHSGYTEAQYRSLAWLISRSTIPEDRITTHREIDRSGSRADPRSFEPERLVRLLRQYRGQAEN